MFSSKVAKFSSLALSGLALSASALADQTYQVAVPTLEPYTRFENHVAAGSFSDSFEFSLDTATEGYIWLFARQDAWFGFSEVENTQAVSLTLRNELTEQSWTGALYPQEHGQVSWFASGVFPLVVAGFDPNKSLYLSGTFGPGNYVATVSGIANGSAGSSYIAKFSLPQAIPEPQTWALMMLGGVAVVVAVRRQRTR